MMSTIQQSMQTPSEYTYQQAVAHGSGSGSPPNRLVGGMHSVEFPQPSFTSLRPTSLLCPSRPVPSLGGGTYDEGTLEFLSAEMNFSALYMHDIHNWRLNHLGRVQHADDERARQLWQTDSPTALDTMSVTHHMPNIQEGSEDEETGATTAAAAGGRETDHLLSHSSTQVQV